MRAEAAAVVLEPMGRFGRLATLGAVAFISAPAIRAQTREAPPCRAEVFRGRATAGEDLAIELSPTLVFRLDAEERPENPAGWTIRVTTPARAEDDFSMVATPPYRFANPRYVDTSYGIPASDALANTPRAFAFVATAEDYATGMRALDVLLWPYSFTDAQVTAASEALEALPRYSASFSIEDGATSRPTPDDPLGRIEWIAFRLDICLPVRL